jgi:hypothetical protein
MKKVISKWNYKRGKNLQQVVYHLPTGEKTVKGKHKMRSVTKHETV